MENVLMYYKCSFFFFFGPDFLDSFKLELVGSLHDYNVLYPRKWSVYIFSHLLL